MQNIRLFINKICKSTAAAAAAAVFRMRCGIYFLLIYSLTQMFYVCLIHCDIYKNENHYNMFFYTLLFSLILSASISLFSSLLSLHLSAEK